MRMMLHRLELMSWGMSLLNLFALSLKSHQFLGGVGLVHDHVCHEFLFMYFMLFMPMFFMFMLVHVCFEHLVLSCSCWFKFSMVMVGHVYHGHDGSGLPWSWWLMFLFACLFFMFMFVYVIHGHGGSCLPWSWWFMFLFACWNLVLMLVHVIHGHGGFMFSMVMVVRVF